MCVIELSTIPLQSPAQIMWLPLHINTKVARHLQAALLHICTNFVILEKREEIQRRRHTV